MERIERLILRFADAVTAHRQSDGSSVLRREDCGRYATVSPADWAVLSDIDGTATVSDLMKRMLERRRGLGLRTMLDRLALLRAQGFLAPETTPVTRAHGVGRIVLGARLRLPSTVRTDIRVWPWGAAAAVGLIALVLGLSLDLSPSLSVEGVGPAAVFNGPALLACWLSVAVILSLRSATALMVLRQARTRPWYIGLAWTWWVPHLWVDARDVRAAGRQARAALALSELAVALLTAAALTCPLVTGGLAPDLGVGAWAGAVATMWWMLRPFGAGPLIELARAWTGHETIWQDARSYLLRALWTRTARGHDPFAYERTLRGLALVYPVWGYAGLVLFGRAMEHGFLPALASVLSRQAGRSHVAAWAVLTLAAGGLAVAVGVPLTGGLAWALRRWRESRTGRTRATAAHDVDGIVALIASTPLFASLPVETLRTMAREAALVDLPDQALAVHQGAPGDSAFVVRHGRMAVIHEHPSGRRETGTVLSAGDIFGEMGLLGDGVRTATVMALERCQVLELPRRAFLHGIEATGLRHDEVTARLQLMHQVRRSPLFADMGPAEVARFLARAARRSLTPGEVLIRQGDPGDHAYVIQSGRFEVLTDGKQTAILGPGDIAGEIAVLTAQPRTATVTAIERSEVFQLDREAFLATLASDFTFGSQIAETARRRLERRA